MHTKASYNQILSGSTLPQNCKEKYCKILNQKKGYTYETDFDVQGVFNIFYLW